MGHLEENATSNHMGCGSSNRSGGRTSLGLGFVPVGIQSPGLHSIYLSFHLMIHSSSGAHLGMDRGQRVVTVHRLCHFFQHQLVSASGLPARESHVRDSMSHSTK